jgi:hypothetical protein
MKVSQSSKWDHASASHVAYDKHNVLSTEMLGGEMCVPRSLLRISETVLFHVTLASALGTTLLPSFINTLFLLCDPSSLM